MKKLMTLFLIVSTFFVAFAQTNIDLQKAIEIVRSTFEIPASFTNFTFNYETFSHNNNWSLRWSTPQQQNQNNESGNMSVTVSASTGEIMNMYFWRETNQSEINLPVISRDQARIIATGLLKRL